MKSLAQQSSAELGGTRSVLSRQRRDHIKLAELLHRLDSISPRQQKPLLIQIYRLVFPHAFAEESVLWPIIRRVLPDGEQLTLQVEREHQLINQLTARLEKLEPDSAERRRVLDSLVSLLRQDVRDEEDELLPRLQLQLTPAQARRLGSLWEIVRRIAPTRAHPIVSRRPPGNVIAALPLSILDRSRDGVDLLAHRSPAGVSRALMTLGTMLARVAHAVEQVPIVRSGEDPSTRPTRRTGAGWAAAAVVGLGVAVSLVGLARRERSAGGRLAS